MINKLPSYTINVGGQLLDLSIPRVMGVINVTPDSFYPGSRAFNDNAIRQKAQQMVDEGVDIIDIGGYSTRPGAAEVDTQEECRRVGLCLDAVRKDFPNVVTSIDTFRADVARMAVEEYGVQIVNDISGGQYDSQMFATVAKLGVPYILTHTRGQLRDMRAPQPYDDLMRDITLYFAQRIDQLHQLGVNDILLDPGPGFAKSLDDNYELLMHWDELLTFKLPIVAAFSRKSMIYRLLGTTANEALNGTTVVNTLALAQGASIFRVHDVRPCVEMIRIWQKMLHARKADSKQ